MNCFWFFPLNKCNKSNFLFPTIDILTLTVADISCTSKLTAFLTIGVMRPDSVATAMEISMFGSSLIWSSAHEAFTSGTRCQGDKHALNEEVNIYWDNMSVQYIRETCTHKLSYLYNTMTQKYPCLKMSAYILFTIMLVQGYSYRFPNTIYTYMFMQG